MSMSPETVEQLARELHEAGREAVERGATVAHANLGEPARRFLEWPEISEEAREGRRIQARWLLENSVFLRDTPISVVTMQGHKVVIERGQASTWGCFALDLPIAFSGDSREEVVRLMEEAIPLFNDPAPTATITAP